MKIRNTPAARIALAAAFVLALALVPAALAKGKPGGGGGSTGGTGSTCTQSTPGVDVQNNYGWSQWGSWGMPGQQLAYFIDVLNYDTGCSGSSFVVTVSAPDGFTVSLPTNTLNLGSGASGHLWAYVTSPGVIADGDYPLTATVSRVGGGSSASFASSYKVYSSDSAAPTLFWATPADGGTISGRSYNVGVSSSDDHAVRKIDLYIDNVYTSEALCDDVSYTCQLSYQWSIGRVSGQHTVTFKSYDWMGNVGVSTETFTVG
jgi:Bacterial Ig domain